MEKQLELFDEYREEIWSFSRLKCLRRCALEYKVRYIDGGKSNFQPGYIDVQTGRLLHDIVRHYYGFPASSRHYDLLLELYKELAPSTLIWKEDLQGEARTLDLLRLFAQSSLSRSQPVALEVSCKAPIGKVVFSGKADLICRTEEHPDLGSVLEFKLNDVEVRTKDPSEMFLQCLIYLMGLPEKYRREVGWVGVYIFDTGQLVEAKIEDSMIEKAVRIIERDIRLAEGPDFPPKRNPFCPSCGYQRICPAFSRSRIKH